MSTTVQQQEIDAVHDVLVGLARVFQGPTYRRRFLHELGGDLDVSTVRVLGAVDRAAPPVTVGCVAEALGVEASTASRMVGRAVDAGYLQRRPGRTDARVRELRVAPAGAVLLDRAARIRRQLIAQCLTGWSAAELADALSTLSRLAEDLEQLGQPSP